MGLSKLEEAISLLLQYKDYIDFCDEKSQEIVDVASSILGIKFPPSYNKFLVRLGAGNFKSEEFYGIINHPNEDAASIPNGVWLTLKHRETSDLPKELILISDAGNGGYYSIDTRKIDSEGEAPIVVWEPGTSTSSSKLEFISPTFGDFFLKRIKRVIRRLES